MWMTHPETGNYADLPDLPYWRARGWQPTAGPPPEPDLLHDPLPDVDDPQVEPRPVPEFPGETDEEAAAAIEDDESESATKDSSTRDQ